MNENIIDEIIKVSKPLNEIADLKPLIEEIKNKKIVMLGECSHGTQEFYEWRRIISNELIKNHGFNFISVEGDWPACQGINEYINCDTSEDSIKVMREFTRWPTWMWGNTEVMNLMDELREWNEDTDSPVGFYGLDVYSLYESIDVVIKTLTRIDPDLASKVKKYYSCFDPYKHDEREYVRSLLKLPEGCKTQVLSALKDIVHAHEEEGLDIIQNATIVKNAENYYRQMLTHEDQSWNVRDKHMMETLEKLLNHYGPDSKGIVWAHNTHIGDYRATDMLMQGSINIGGLARERFGADHISLVGFTTFHGKVIASNEWDGPITIMNVPRAKDNSLEYFLHEAIPAIGNDNYYLCFKDTMEGSQFNEYIGHRAIGVVYSPGQEQRGNYVPTMVAGRYDWMVFFDETHALRPLNVKFESEKIPETFPFGDRI